MPRVKKCITIPSDLMKEMQKIKDINWSKVACDAFCKIIFQHTKRQGNVVIEIHDILKRIKVISDELESLRRLLDP